MSRHMGWFCSRSQSFRRCGVLLMENGYVTEREEMVMEDGKYYPMMRVHLMLPQSLMQTALQKNRNWNSAMESSFLQKNIRCFWRISAGKRRSSRIF